MRRLITLFCTALVLLCGRHHALAQDLLYVAPVLNGNVNKDTGTCLLITMMDLARYASPPVKEVKPFNSSIQILDADLSWPPRWYSATPVYTDAMFAADNKAGMYTRRLIVDASVQGKYLSFYKLMSHQAQGTSMLEAPQIAGYILLNQNMEAVDTAKTNSQKRNIFYHDFRINERGERLVDVRKESYIDLRDYTENPKDTAIHCNIDYIQILDEDDNVLFSWNPVEHVNPKLFNFKEILAQPPPALGNPGSLIEWTRLTSALFDYDGDILFSMRGIGLGKFSRADGRVLWQIDYTQLPMKVGNDVLNWYSPHDFELLYNNDTSAFYTVFSNGAQGVRPACGEIFELSKKTHKVLSVKHIMPREAFLSIGQGNLDYKSNGEYLMAYGNRYEPMDDPDFRNDLEYGKGDSLYGIYLTPKRNSIFKGHRLENWPKPPRPVIVKEDGKLNVVGNLKGWVWYKLSGKNLTTIELAGTGDKIIPDEGATYCVEGKYGIGFCVSRPYTFSSKNPDSKAPVNTKKTGTEDSDKYNHPY